MTNNGAICISENVSQHKTAPWCFIYADEATDISYSEYMSLSIFILVQNMEEILKEGVMLSKPQNT